MRILVPFAIAAAACVAAAIPASAQVGDNTGRPSYDNPRLFDRDAYGNETGHARYYYGPDNYGPAYSPHYYKKKYRYYDDD